MAYAFDTPASTMSDITRFVVEVECGRDEWVRVDGLYPPANRLEDMIAAVDSRPLRVRGKCMPTRIMKETIRTVLAYRVY